MPTIQKSNSLKGAVITASNKTRQKSLRLWYKVPCTGKFKESSRDGSLMIEVSESDQTRWLNMATINRGFLSTVNGLSQLWENGQKINETVLPPSHIETIHETII